MPQRHPHEQEGTVCRGARRLAIRRPLRSLGLCTVTASYPAEPARPRQQPRGPVNVQDDVERDGPDGTEQGASAAANARANAGL